MSKCLLLFLFAFLGSGCEVKQIERGAKTQERQEQRQQRQQNNTQAPTAVRSTKGEAWDRIREVCFESRNCFWGKYCIKDPAFVDPILLESLDKFANGELPTTSSKIEQLAVQTKNRYRNALDATPESRAILEALIKQGYEVPVVADKGDTLEVDLGYAPGKLENYGREVWVIKTSDVVEKDELKTTEVARFLSHYSSLYPTKDILITVNVLRGTSPTTITYRFKRLNKRIVVNRNDRVSYDFYTDPVEDWAPYINGQKSLNTLDLHSCNLKERYGRYGDKECNY